MLYTHPGGDGASSLHLTSPGIGYGKGFYGPLSQTPIPILGMEPASIVGVLKSGSPLLISAGGTSHL